MDIILIPGFWLDASSWDEGAPGLRQAGHRVQALTLPGMDSFPLGEGGLINDELPVENGEVPLPDWSLFEQEDLIDLDDDLRAAFRARAIPTPVQVTSDRQRLSDERRYDVPATVIACEFSGAQLREWMAQDHPALRELAKVRDVGYVDLPTGHWPQFTKPGELREPGG